MLLAAVQRLAAAGELPVRAAFVVEGEEESGGTSALDHFAADAAPALAAIIFDSPMIAPGRPAICTGVRGMVYRRVTVRTAGGDAHSGLFGGAALNAAHALLRIIDAVAPHEGRLPAPCTPGSPRPVRRRSPPGTSCRRAPRPWRPRACVRPTPARRRASTSARWPRRRSTSTASRPASRPRSRPTSPARPPRPSRCGSRPARTPERIAATLDELLRAAAPVGAELTIEDLGVALPAALDPEHPVLVAAADGIERGTGWRPAPVRLGGTLPVVAVLAAKGIPTILTGFGLPDDAIHAPDEHLRVEYLETGTRAAMGLLAALGERTTEGA